MLILKRGLNEEIVFPLQDIVVRVVRVSGNCVRLAIEAPKSVPIKRSELVEGSCDFHTRTDFSTADQH